MSTTTTMSTMQKVYFWSSAILAIPSIGMYLAMPGGTVKHFGGTPTPSAEFWCQLTAGGDAVIAFLNLYAVLSKSNNNDEIRKLVVRSNALYSLFHIGGFLRGHYAIEPMPSGPAMQWVGLAVAGAAFWTWGI